ncbi:MAG: hypothetical protein HQ534_07800 [Armatimonadetes bacterium]|nr:hypothetical protein [Armatimonadota bacterium]
MSNPNLWNIETEKKFEVQIYYSGYCTYYIKANSETEAIELPFNIESLPTSFPVPTELILNCE